MSKRFLVVEDEDDNLTLVIHILKFVLGQQDILIAHDGLDAIRIAYSSHPDIILMDLTLPNLDGWEAIRSLRSDAQFHDTIIVALTAHAMVGDRERALEIGCNEYLSKPLDIDQFIEFVEPYLAEA
ncbi:MAG: response regulator [Anaerolineae bacterium]|nr:response regulator [Anaerolineae bacterium]